ncbi:MAG: phosphoribosylformylglycinamidine synthase [Treponema sp.]|jgi:phosphoribosylformylglycinamidine synthase|nr:phosphoribosylformylglycinamidine synthase [Treponema sp.]
MSVRRVFIEKRQGFDLEAKRLQSELVEFLGGQIPELGELKAVRIFRRYDVDGLSAAQFEKVTEAVFAEAQCDMVFYGAEVPAANASAPETSAKDGGQFFGVEFLSGQYDQRADSAEQCAELVTGTKPAIKTATFYLFESAGKPLTSAALEGIKKYLINPVDSRLASCELPLSLEETQTVPPDVPVLAGFINSDGFQAIAKQYGLAMSIEDLHFCRDYFAREGRDPTLAELRVLDTYWSDHCRHTTFNTILEDIKIADNDSPVAKAYALYEETRRIVYGETAETKNRSLMDMATIAAKALKKKSLLDDLDESPEVNACTVKVTADFSDGSSEPWLLLFKNETHNHPTEIEPFGGAATCLGGAIRDPLSGRAFVHQAMRITGGGDPRASLSDTLPGKLPQVKIAREAASGYSSYGNQIGLATGLVAEFYHQGFLAKRMELGGVIGAVPENWVRREEPATGDVVILVGGRTGRDGIGGATGSSKVQSGESVESAGAEVQKGNAVEERKLQRLFRSAKTCRLIKRCNDFGAGGVSVAVGELAAGLDINLDAVPKKYAGLDGTELAISESQERMAVVTAAEDAQEFIDRAAEENLEAVIIATVSAGNSVSTNSGEKARLRMSWRGKTIVDLAREFLDTNGAPRTAKVLIEKSGHEPARSVNPADALPAEVLAELPSEVLAEPPSEVLINKLERELMSLRSGSRRGLQERFDGSIGAASVLFPWGGSEQGTPECGMAALLPSLDPAAAETDTENEKGRTSATVKQSRTASLMTFGYDPELMSLDPYSGAKGSVREALAKFACLGGNPFTARLSFQEYFQRLNAPEIWGKPAAALLGALEAQLKLGVPAIGGKDSMSGNYRDEAFKLDLAVPPTLVAFAAGTAAADKVRSSALSGKAGNAIVLLSQSAQNADEWVSFKTNMKTIAALAELGALKAASPVTSGGVAASLAIMAFGNMSGVEAYADSFSAVDALQYQGSVLAEIDESALPAAFDHSWILAGRTLADPVFRIVRSAAAQTLAESGNPEALSAEIHLAVLRRAYEYPLASVFPQTSTGATVAELAEKPADEKNSSLKLPPFKANAAMPAAGKPRFSAKGAPLVVLPVFPGTNCEWDMQRAFHRAGAKIRLVIFRNRSPEDIAASLKELAAAFAQAHIIALSGGFSAGDEPDGSGKFIANVLRSPLIANSITDFLENRDGLMLGICNGFQALIKTGLVPYGRIVQMEDTMPTLTYNAIGRHVSRIVRTRVMPSASPWLSLDELGTIHSIPVSHGEGRLVIRDEEAAALFAAAQVPFCYADAGGNPTMSEPDNPNGSAFAIEGLSSPDGRVLGKMGHPERYGEFVHVNIPGNKHMRIFEAGVRYFAG